MVEVFALDPDQLDRCFALGRMDGADIVEFHVAGVHQVGSRRLDLRRLRGIALLDDVPVGYFRDAGGLSIDCSARAVVVRRERQSLRPPP